MTNALLRQNSVNSVFKVYIPAAQAARVNSHIDIVSFVFLFVIEILDNLGLFLKSKQRTT